MDVPSTDEVKAQLAAALAELHTQAGWACHDSGLDGAGYFTRGMALAHQTGDTYAIADARRMVDPELRDRLRPHGRH
ncbi:MAG: hypothetical protein ACRDQ4_15465 [Pseudonocardiaceae bacterium]